MAWCHKDQKRIEPKRFFDAPDCDELLNWLRRQPLLVYPNDKTVMVHAGIPPNWSITQAAMHASELQTQLQSSLWQLDRLLPNLYSDTAVPWSNMLTGYARMRAICNYFTRMRLCQMDGTLEFSFKSSLDDKMPEGFVRGLNGKCRANVKSYLVMGGAKSQSGFGKCQSHGCRMMCGR